MGFQQFSPVRRGLALRATETLCGQPRQLMGLEEIYVATLERLAHVAREVENRQVLADEATHSN